MKRALAERAKQHSVPPTASNLSPQLLHSEPPELPLSPLRKTPRTFPTTNSTIPQSSSVPSSPHHSPDDSGTTSKKRQRPSTPPAPVRSQSENEDDMEEDNVQNAFYLRHQNKALAAELKSFKRQIFLLERERGARRRHCKTAGDSLREVVGIWRGAEVAVLGALHTLIDNSGTTTTADETLMLNDSIGKDMFTPQKRSIPLASSSPLPPASTGDGTDVETISNLMDAISQLAATDAPLPIRISVEENELTKNRSISPNLPQHETALSLSQSEVLHDDIVTSHSCDNPPLHPVSKSRIHSVVHTKSEEELNADERMLEAEETYLGSLKCTAQSFSERLAQFQKGLYSLLRHFLQNGGNASVSASSTATITVSGKGRKLAINECTKYFTNSDDEDNENEHENNDLSFSFDTVALHQKIATLQGQCSDLENQLDELASSRDSAASSERKVRRGLYRVASGRMKIGDVLQEIEKDGSCTLDDLTGLRENASIGQHLNLYASPIASAGGEALYASSDRALHSLSKDFDGSPAPVISSGDNAITSTPGGCGDGAQFDSNELLGMKKKLQDYEVILKCRDEKISELFHCREELQKKINAHVASNTVLSTELTTSDFDVKSSPLFIETATKLANAEREVKELKDEMERTIERWAVTKGDLEVARKAIDDLEEKHKRRWKELSGSWGDQPFNGSLTSTEIAPTNGSMHDPAEIDGDHEFISDARKNITLEHKLKHAMENVRQAEAVRVLLAEANLMNEALQTKLEEFKTKNAALVATKAAARAISSSETVSSHTALAHRSSREAIYSPSSSENLAKEHKKMRKELAASLRSKDSAKAKQERAEKERDALMKTNARLIKQSAEKDDMNAKSLTSILHLKHLTEQLEQEKHILEKRLKGAEQLALAARLAANAKDRVEEEAMRDKEHALNELKLAKERMSFVLKQKEEVECHLQLSKNQTALAVKDLSSIRKRCDELAAESTVSEEDKRQLNEALAVTKKEAEESTKTAVAAALARNPHGGHSLSGVDSESGFTAEQLTIQVNGLKGRLACPVCNHRDKQVILLRCRHMFCRQCVDQNIKNRSRKCPACAQRFDTKDVGDVWL